MSNAGSETPKIIVDDDWKEKVQREKEIAKQHAGESAPAAEVAPVAPKTASAGPAAKSSAKGNDEDPALPPPSFSLLVSLLANQAITLLGQMPDPVSGKTQVRPRAAKHAIDLLAVLEEKTKGNLSAMESGMLTSVLHELRMAYVAVTSRK